MKRVRVTMELIVDDEKCADLIWAIDHHAEWQIDSDIWAKIISISSCKIEDLDTQDWDE